MKSKIRFGIVGSILLTTLFGCGKRELTDSEEAIAEGAVPVVGYAGFASQCPYGTLSEPVPTAVLLWDCPIGAKKVELVEPLETMIFQADCKKKLLTVRSGNRVMDTTWEVMPDGSFFFNVDAGKAKLKSAGTANLNCTSQLSADMFGKMDCSDRDKAKIEVDVVWWTDPKRRAAPASNPSPSPSMSPSPRPTEAPIPVADACNLPKGCYFHTALRIPQCS